MMLFCDYCKSLNNNLRKIQSNKGKKGYALCCKSCESKHGLEDVPTFTSNKLVDFCEERQFDPISPTILETSDGLQYLQFHNGRLELLRREELQLIADEIQKTLTLDASFDEFIEKENLYKRLNSLFSYSNHDKDKFQIPYDRLRLSKRIFNSEKNKWSFSCGNCSELINIDVQKNYYTMVPHDIFKAGSDRSCSAACTKVIIKDIIQNWLHDSGTVNYFYIDHLDEEIRDFINEQALKC